MSTGEEQIQRMRSLHGDAWADFARTWIGHALRKGRIDPASVTPAVEALYQLADLPAPRVARVPSPGVAAFAGAFAAQIWDRREIQPSYDPVRNLSGSLAIPPACQVIVTATVKAIHTATALTPGRSRVKMEHDDLYLALLNAVYGPADAATVNALSRDDWMKIKNAVAEMEALSYWNECVNDAMRDRFGNPKPTDMLEQATKDWALALAVALFGEGEAPQAINAAGVWWKYAESGNNGLYDTVCISAAREFHKLDLPELHNYPVWEQYKISGGYRYEHPEFCLVSDFPEAMDEASMQHPTQVRRKSLAYRQSKPVMKWRDGWFV